MNRQPATSQKSQQTLLPKTSQKAKQQQQQGSSKKTTNNDPSINKKTKSVVAKKRRQVRKNKRPNVVDAMDVDRVEVAKITTNLPNNKRQGEKPKGGKQQQTQRRRRRRHQQQQQQQRKKMQMGQGSTTPVVVELKLPSTSFNPFVSSPFTYEPTTPNPFVPSLRGVVFDTHETTPLMATTATAEESTNNKWPCPQCTLHNDTTRLACAACGWINDDDMSL